MRTRDMVSDLPVVLLLARDGSDETRRVAAECIAVMYCALREIRRQAPPYVAAVGATAMLYVETHPAHLPGATTEA